MICKLINSLLSIIFLVTYIYLDIYFICATSCEKITRVAMYV